MNRAKLIILIAGVAVLSFLVGNGFQRKSSVEAAPSGAARILYYIDPMHPAYKSDKPGIAPDCGMALVPVYAGESPSDAAWGSAAHTSGSVNISREKQQLLGIRVEEVKSTAPARRIRLSGRVAADETRVYFLNSSTDGWIRETFSNSTGSLVKKDEVLATCYAPEFIAAEQAFFYALNALDRFKASGAESPEQLAVTQVSVKQSSDTLRNLGMGDVQIQALARDRRTTENIEIRSPATGFVVERNVSPGLRFERGKQLFRIADLNRMWVVADIFENEARFIRPGGSASVKYQGRTWQARMADVLPQFDPASRALKLRFELENPNYALRPDMFVDVEFPVNLPSGITVPVDAVIDSGLKKTVFVDHDGSNFEPRIVETGWRMGDRIQVTKNLEPGERIVFSGAFLLDSETRMTATADNSPKDVVCRMEIDPGKAAGKSEYKGKTYYFCSKSCKEKFDKDPGQYIGKEKEQSAHAAAPHD